MQMNNLDNTPNLFNWFEEINFETPWFSFDNFNPNALIQMKADSEDGMKTQILKLFILMFSLTNLYALDSFDLLLKSI